MFLKKNQKKKWCEDVGQTGPGYLIYTPKTNLKRRSSFSAIELSNGFSFDHGTPNQKSLTTQLLKPSIFCHTVIFADQDGSPPPSYLFLLSSPFLFLFLFVLPKTWSPFRSEIQNHELRTKRDLLLSKEIYQSFRSLLFCCPLAYLLLYLLLFCLQLGLNFKRTTHRHAAMASSKEKKGKLILEIKHGVYFHPLTLKLRHNLCAPRQSSRPIQCVLNYMNSRSKNQKESFKRCYKT